MNKTITMLGKTIDVRLTKRAVKHLEKRTKILCLEMELYFSCMIRKQVRVLDSMNTKLVAPIGNNLVVGFRPVMTKVCSVAETECKPPLTDFPIKKPENYIPSWLKVDFRKGKWVGDFGYDAHGSASVAVTGK